MIIYNNVKIIYNIVKGLLLDMISKKWYNYISLRYGGRKMAVKQISVFLEHKCGSAFSIVDLFGKNNINIAALSITETEGYGVLRFIVDDTEKALEILKPLTGLIIKCADVLAVELEDKPGSLARLLEIIKDSGEIVSYLYAFTQRIHEHVVVVVKTKDIVKTSELLSKNDIAQVDSSFIFNK